MKNDLKQLSDIDVSLNRLRSQKVAILHKLKKSENKQRKARTRTLIQLGGLLDLTPLLSICNINLGEDLQLEHPDKATILLGIISDLCKYIPDQISENELNRFKTIGLKLLKQST